jgi:tRNA-splicing ligase RtcB
MKDKFANIIMENTYFGVGCESPKGTSHEVLDDPSFDSIPFLKRHNLRDVAIRQIGTSGSGNHFISMLIADIGDGIPKIALLSHSGSRGFGAKIAKFYGDMATSICKLPRQIKNAAWLNMDSDEGKEYWEAMQLAGRYTKANHDLIHLSISKALKEKPCFEVSHPHNFAWKETLSDGRDVIVHRKGATPAGKDVMGIIPGSMATPSYIVSGLGNSDSLNSSSHGAGRAMSRKQANESFTKSAMNKFLEEAGVTLLSGGLDECPMAYKNILQVMEAQKDLVKVVGTLKPFLVRMADDGTSEG